MRYVCPIDRLMCMARHGPTITKERNLVSEVCLDVHD